MEGIGPIKDDAYASSSSPGGGTSRKSDDRVRQMAAPGVRSAASICILSLSCHLLSLYRPCKNFLVSPRAIDVVNDTIRYDPVD